MTKIADIHKAILEVKEQRWLFTQEYITKNNSLVCSFKLNIPSWPKNSEEIQLSFEKAFQDFNDFSVNNNVILKIIKKSTTILGPEIYLTCECNANELKKLAISFEETYFIGRLLDIDIIDINGLPIDRKNKRRCFLCNDLAINCMRSNKHSPNEIKSFFDEKITEFLAK